MIVGSGNVYAISFYGNRYTSVDRVHQLALIAAAEACEGYPRFFVDNFEFPEGKNAEIMTAECLLPPDEHEDYYSYRSKMWRRGSEVKPYLEARTRVIAEDRALLAECEENQEKTGWAMLGAIGAALAIGLIVLAISGP